MEYAVDYSAIIVAAIASMIVGFVWYMPAVFGRAWMKSGGIPESSMEAGKKKMPLMMGAGLAAQFVMAYVLAHVGNAFGASGISGALALAFWMWLGFVATVLLGSVLWEMKPVKYYLINALYWLVSISVMAMIIVAWL